MSKASSWTEILSEMTPLCRSYQSSDNPRKIKQLQVEDRQSGILQVYLFSLHRRHKRSRTMSCYSSRLRCSKTLSIDKAHNQKRVSELTPQDHKERQFNVAHVASFPTYPMKILPSSEGTNEWTILFALLDSESFTT